MEPSSGGASRKLRSFLHSPLLKFLLKAGIAAALIAWVIGGDGRAMLHSIRRMNPLWMLLCFLAILGQTAGTAVRWKFLIAKELNVSFSEAFHLTAIGLFANLFFPGGAVGGDVVKATLLASRAGKGKRVEATISILVDRIVGMAGLFLLTLGLLLVFLRRILELPPAAGFLVFVLAMICVGGLLATCVLFFQDFIFRWAPAAKLLAFADRWMRGVPGGIVRSVSAYRSRWRTLGATTVFSALLLHPLLILAMFFALYGELGHLPEAGTTMTAVACGSVAAAVPVTPGGIGTRDAVITTLLSAWGMPESSAATAMILYTAMLLLLDLLCGIAFFLPGARGRGPVVRSGEDGGETAHCRKS